MLVNKKSGEKLWFMLVRGADSILTCDCTIQKHKKVQIA